MTRRLALLAALGLLTGEGCATSPAAQRVRLERVSNDVAFLTFREATERTCRLVRREKLASDGGPHSRRHAREYAVVIGSDTVIWLEYNDSPDRVSHADFYRCRE